MVGVAIFVIQFLWRGLNASVAVLRTMVSPIQGGQNVKVCFWFAFKYFLPCLALYFARFGLHLI